MYALIFVGVLGVVTYIWLFWCIGRILAHLLIKLYLYKWKYRNAPRGLCCCGLDMDKHGKTENHGAVDSLEYGIEQEMRTSRHSIIANIEWPFKAIMRLVTKIM